MSPRAKDCSQCLVDLVVSHHLAQEVQLLEVCGPEVLHLKLLEVCGPEVLHLKLLVVCCLEVLHLQMLEVCGIEVLHPKNLQAKGCFPCLVHLHLSNHPVPEVNMWVVLHQEDLPLDLLYLVAFSQVLLQTKIPLAQVCFPSLEVLVPSPKLDQEYPRLDQQLHNQNLEVRSSLEKDCSLCLVDSPSRHQKHILQLPNHLNQRAFSKFPLCFHSVEVQMVRHSDLLVLYHINNPGQAWSGNQVHQDKEWEHQEWEVHEWEVPEWADLGCQDQDIQDHRSPPKPQQKQQQQQQQQQKSFFGLPSSIGPESLTNDLFGIFKGSEAAKSEEQQQYGSEAKQGDTSANVTVSESTENTDAERTPLPGDVHVKSTEETEVPEKGLVEEAEGTDRTEEEESSLTESNMKTDLPQKKAEDDESLRSQGSAVPDKAELPQAPESKGMFELPGLSASKFGFMSVAAEGTSSIGSLFSSTPSPATGAKAPQPQQTEGGLFSGFKNLSAGIFQDEKPTGKEETSSASSMFGMKLGSMFGSSEPPKPESPTPVITAQPQSQSPKPTEEADDPEFDQLSQGSEETGSADASDTEGPTETSKSGSCDTLTQSQSGLRSQSDSLAEGLDKPQLEITTWNLSPVSSQLSSEPEERQHPESCPPRGPHPPLHSQPSTWDEEEEEEEDEKELRPIPEPGSNKDLKDSTVVLPKPILDNHDNKTPTKISFFEDGPPPCSPSKVRWLKAYNKSEGTAARGAK
ncbi:unnamed protein product [Pleuronectes platessa]|uniref:Uncharacterized protein n=1 Tax=Pleuronectes platessa TaxID=8262 RepID=A0A9N7YE66_PLEPL|nr:unnamed protein product [Pleuronectes platessa]